MLKIKELFKEFIETQKQINESIKELKETKDFENSKLSSTICTINKLENAIESNVYTKEQTIEAINKEMDYKKDLEKAQQEYPELLELIETISTNYPRMDKYGILDAAKIFSKEYRVEKV